MNIDRVPQTLKLLEELIEADRLTDEAWRWVDHHLREQLCVIATAASMRRNNIRKVRKSA